MTVSVAYSSMRTVYGQTLRELGRKNERIVVLAADCMASCKASEFASEFPERAFNFGIAEQQMISAAAGFATCGYIPFAHTFAMLASMRTCEQVRTDIAYPNLNVKIVGTSGGVVLGPSGPTHHALEDIGIMRLFPNMTVVVPSDPVETEFAVKSILEHEGPVYLRLGRDDEPVFNEEPYAHLFAIGKAITLREGKDVSLIGTGIMVGECLKAARLLAEKGIKARVLNIHTIKPLDEEAVLKAATETRGIVVAEEHNTIGGLGDSVASVVAEHHPTWVRKVGFRDVFPIIGSRSDLFDYYGLTSKKIAEEALEILSLSEGRNSRKT